MIGLRVIRGNLGDTLYSSDELRMDWRYRAILQDLIPMVYQDDPNIEQGLFVDNVERLGYPSVEECSI